jgi:hypothetical protein
MAEFPKDIPDVATGLELLSQADCLVALDEAMSRRPHNRTELRYQIALWRRDRTAWRDARDRRADAKEAAADDA